MLRKGKRGEESNLILFVILFLFLKESLQLKIHKEWETVGERDWGYILLFPIYKKQPLNIPLVSWHFENNLLVIISTCIDVHAEYEN